MAKKNGITISDALIPKDDYPYDVPNNWCWVKLGAISSIISKGTTPKGGKSAYVDEGIDFLRVENINDDGTICHDNMMHVTEETHTGFLKRSMLKENDVLVSIAGTLGKTAIVKKDDLPLNTNQAVAFVRLADNGEISRDFIRYAIDTPVIQNMLLAKTKVTAIPNLTLEIISDCLIPLPPLAEQKRIVEQIENLFSKLDEAKEKLEEAKDGLELEKKSILYNAFSGSLTKKWREDNNIEDLVWNPIPLSEVFDLKSGATISEDDEQEEGIIPYVKVGDMNLEENLIQITTSTRFVDDCTESHIIPRGSTIFPKRGGAILTNKKRYVAVEKIIADLNTMAVIPKKDKAIGWFGYYWMQSIDLRQLNNGSSVPQINNKDMVKLNLGCPSIEEQEELVRLLHSYFDRYYTIIENIESSITQIELIKKSILAKAFRGKLRTNIADEESSIEFLKSIIEA